MQAKLRLRAQILLALVTLLATSLVLIFLVARGIGRTSLAEQRLEEARQTARLLASLAGRLTRRAEGLDPAAVRAEWGALIDDMLAHPEVGRALLLDRGLEVLAPGDGVPFWPPEDIPRLLRMMDDEDVAYRYPDGASRPHLWVMAPVSGGEGADSRRWLAEGGVAAVALSFDRFQQTEARLLVERLLLVSIAIIIAGLAILMHVVLTRVVVMPLGRIVRTIDRVQGAAIPDLDAVKTSPVRGNEMELLSDAVDRMLQRLGADKRRISESMERLRDLNRRLVRAQETLVRSEKLASVGRLAAGVAHEIGNPLAIALGYVDILRQGGVGSAEQQEYLADIAAATGRIHTIIRDLLEFSRPARDGEETARVQRAIDTSVKLMKPQAKFREVAIDVRWLGAEGGDPAAVEAHMNEGRLQQVLVNLLINAADAMGGKGRIGIAFAEVGQHVRLSVADDGPGIPEAEQLRVFDPFYTTKDPGEGTGLGLAICYSLVSAYGGQLTVESAPGAGACFHIELWRPEHAPDDLPGEGSTFGPPGAEGDRRGIEVRR